MNKYVSLLLAGCLAACAPLPPTPPAPSKDNVVAPAYRLPVGDELILILPESNSYADMKAGEKLVRQQLYKQLTAAGYKVKALELSSASEVWKEEVTKVGGIYNPVTGKLRSAAQDKAMAGFAARVCEELKCGLLLWHKLVPRRATVDGFEATWDGQQRAVPRKNETMMLYRLDGGYAAISVELIGRNMTGSEVFRTYGGVSLSMFFDESTRKLQPRTDLFSNDTEVAQGVQAALMPVLQP
jgi:hypothetical protein